MEQNFSRKQTKQNKNMSNEETNTLFIIASRKKFRFTFTRGSIGIEDLWDLNLLDLDKIAVALDAEIQKAGGKTFIAKRTASTTELTNKLEIVKHVIQTKQDEADIAKARRENEAKRATLNNLLERKQIEKLEGMTEEEIKKQLAELQA